MTSALSRDPYQWLYPKSEPYKTHLLAVSPLHQIYVEESGNPEGKPVIFVHGGPGAGSDGGIRRFFNPDRYRIILFDQRGCGKSKPHAELSQNTTWDLVSDMEVIRKHLRIERWQVFGGSWGSTLALAYAETHPTCVTELVLRGIFLLRKRDIDWFYQYGASLIFPDAWKKYEDFIPANERNDFVKAYHRRLTGENESVRIEAAKVWSQWEGACSRLHPDQNFIDKYGEDTFALQFARIEAHYFVNRGFLKTDNQLVEDAHRLRDIPTVIVHGRYDIVCPVDGAFALKEVMPHAEFFLIPDAGHSVQEHGISRALVAATDRFASS